MPATHHLEYVFKNGNMGSKLIGRENESFKKALMKRGVEIAIKDTDIKTVDENGNQVVKTGLKCIIEGRNHIEVLQAKDQLIRMDEEAESIWTVLLVEKAKIKEKFNDKASLIREESDDNAEWIKDRASNKATRVLEKADEEAERIKEKASDQASKIKDKARDKAERIREDQSYTEAVNETNADQIEEEAKFEAQRIQLKGVSQADKILDEANEEATRIRNRADKDADRILRDAQNDIDSGKDRCDDKVARITRKAEKDIDHLIADACHEVKKFKNKEIRATRN